MADTGDLSRTPYFFSGRRPYREERLLSYIHRQHRLGRHLSEILDDPYVLRYGSQALVWQTVRNTPLIGLLEQDVLDAIQSHSEALSGRG